MDAHDLFRSFFGSADPFGFDHGSFGASTSAHHSTARRAPPPTRFAIRCSLEELYCGCTKKLKIRRKIFDARGGFQEEEKVVAIEVRPGWKSGTKVTFPGMSDQRAGEQAGDVVVTIEEKEHDYLKREGDNLVYAPHL
jgi:DnaJ-class molecular chaperone